MTYNDDLKMALIRVVELIIFAVLCNCVTGLQVYYPKQPVTNSVPIFDAKIECNVSKLAWDYANMLLPLRDLRSVYDALQLFYCNVPPNKKAQETK